MEQNMPVISKKVWSLVRVVLYMLKKRISSKGKLMSDLNIMLKRGKIAGKALHNLMFHHHHHHHHHAWSISAALHHRRHHHHHNKNHPFFPSPPPGEYEFSCSNSPAAYPISLFSFHKKHTNTDKLCRHAAPESDELETVYVNAAVFKALEMLQSGAASPALSEFGKSPMVRQLRVTDSPFPLQGIDEDSHIDEAADEFIMKFYNDLRRQNQKMSFDLSSH